MSFELNVSHGGVHLFATAARSGRDSTRFFQAARELVARFPESEGFKISISKATTRSHTLTMDELTEDMAKSFGQSFTDRHLSHTTKGNLADVQRDALNIVEMLPDVEDPGFISSLVEIGEAIQFLKGVDA